MLLLKQGILELIFYGDLVYKFKRIVGKSNLSDKFKNIIKRYRNVYSYGFLFHCTMMGQASMPITALA